MTRNNETHGRAPQPIFVVGLNRSGTKWLSNELSRHPRIACVLSEKTGIRETNMFRGFGRKFDLSRFDEFIALVELWSATDFFERTGIDKARIYQLDPLPRDSYELLVALMNLFAQRLGKSHWLQKAQPMAGLELWERFPQAHFVAIRRDRIDQVRSHVKLSGDRSLRNLARATFAYTRDNRILDRFSRRAGCPEVTYGEMNSNKDAVIGALLKGWGLEPMPAERDSHLLPNSSFSASDARDKYFTAFQRGWISLLGGLLSWIPTGVMFWFARRSWRRLGPVVPGTFDNIHRRTPDLRRRFHGLTAESPMEMPENGAEC